MGFLLVGTYWPWSGREAPSSPTGMPIEVTHRPTGQARVKAVVRTFEGQVLTFTQAPAATALGTAKQSVSISMGIKQRSRNGVSLLFPAVQVNIHL